MSGKILCFVAIIITLIMAFDVEIERPEVNYFDVEEYRYVNVSVRRQSRKGPRLVFIEYYSLKPQGNNVSVHVQLFENLSGRFMPTMLTTEWKMCDFYEKEPFLGQMLAKQFPPNVTCPFQSGHFSIPAVEVHLEKFPYIMPLTWPFKVTGARADITWQMTETKHVIVKLYVFMKVIQNSGVKSNKTG